MATQEPYSVELWVTPRAGPESRVFDLSLFDHQWKGWAFPGVARLDFFEDPDTALFLNAFLRGESVRLKDGLSFGRELAARLFAKEELGQGWSVVEQRRGGRPLRLELVLPADLDEDAGAPKPRVALDDIPFELLADAGGEGFWFRRPGWSLVRTFTGLPAVAYRIPKKGRALLAWANPLVPHEDGTDKKLDEAIFDAHEGAFDSGVRALGLEPREPLRKATPDGLRERLLERPETPLIALVAHGEAKGGAVVLHAAEGSEEGTGVLARDLAAMCRAGDVKVALLWMCHGAKRNAQRSSVAAALLDPGIGDAAAVLASHAAFRADRTTRLAPPLFRSLGDVAKGDLERAVTEARHALAEDDLQWAAPVYYARPLEGRSVSLEERLELVISESVLKRGAAGLLVEGAPPARPWFRGRGDEIARSVEFLRAHRLVTFAGMPGIGKTALAVEVSRRAMEDASGGLSRGLWVDLATKANAAALRDSLAVLFGLDPARCADDLALAKGVGEARALVVLDNAEDLQRKDGDGLRALLDTLLRYAPGLRALVTSRRALGQLDGIEEHVFPVGRLPKGVDREVFVAVAGERLAQERADGAAVDALVAALEGHPQSIVLVAGQVGRGMPLRELQARVEAEDPEVVQDAELLDDEVGEERDAPLRTRRLVSSLNLSFRPLAKAAPGAAEMFAWLGVFPAGLPEALVTAVFGDEAKRHVVRLMALNMIERRGPEDRLGLPGPVRWYARKQQGAVIDGRAVIEPGRREELLERSAVAMASWLVALHAKVGKPGAAAACSSAAEDGANMAALTSEMLAASKTDVIGGGLSRAFEAYGQLALHGGFQREAVAIGERVLAMISQCGSPRDVAVVGKVLGDLFARTDRLTDGERAYEQAIPIFHSLDARAGEASTLLAMGDLMMRTARTGEAEQAYKQAFSIFRVIENRPGEAHTLRALGELFVRVDRLIEAEQAYEQALLIYRAIENRLGEANTLRVLANLFVRVDRLTEAEQAYEQALPIYRAIEHRLGEAHTLRALGELFARTYRMTGAERAYEQALPIYRAIEDRMGEAHTLQSMGDLFEGTNRLTDAERAFEQALRIYRTIEYRQGEANTLQGMGNLALAKGTPIKAFAHILSALRIQEAIHDALGNGGTHGYLARIAAQAGHLERAVVLGCRAFAILQSITDRFGQMVAANEVALALVKQKDDDAGAVFALVWAMAREIGHPWAEQYEPFIRKIGIDPDNVQLDKLHNAVLATLKAVSDRYEQILRDRGEDPYSPLEAP